MTKKKPLTREELLVAIQDSALKMKDVEVPGMGTVTIRELTAKQKLEVGIGMVGEDGKANMAKTPDMMLKATAYGLGLGLDAIPLLDQQPTLVGTVSQEVIQLSNLENGLEQSKKS